MTRHQSATSAWFWWTLSTRLLIFTRARLLIATSSQQISWSVGPRQVGVATFLTVPVQIDETATQPRGVLIDFGICRDKVDETQTTRAGTPSFMDPDANGHYDGATDMYSVGAT